MTGLTEQDMERLERWAHLAMEMGSDYLVPVTPQTLQALVADWRRLTEIEQAARELFSNGEGSMAPDTWFEHRKRLLTALEPQEQAG